VRLGDGTAESRTRVTAALEVLWPFTGELFEADETDRAVIADVIGVEPKTLQDPWRDCVARVFAQATLSVPKDGFMREGGRKGQHSEHLGHLLAEMQYLQRAMPGATW
jgi:ring-1,2-phenylacetyl-CoA epoxidase subunit PaaC